MGKIIRSNAIDYEKTLGHLEPGDAVLIPYSENNIENIRAQVVKMKTKLPGMSFRVNKTINGASITRVE